MAAYRGWIHQFVDCAIAMEVVCRNESWDKSSELQDWRKRIFMARRGGRCRVMEDRLERAAGTKKTGTLRASFPVRRDFAAFGTFALNMHFGPSSPSTTDITNADFAALAYLGAEAPPKGIWLEQPTARLLGEWYESTKFPWLGEFALSEISKRNEIATLSSLPNRWGTLTVEIDQGRAGMPVRWRLEQQPGDLYVEGVTLRDYGKHAPSFQIPPAPLMSRTAELRVLESKQFGAYWFPTFFTYRTEIVGAGGRKCTEEQKITVSDVRNFATDEDLSFATPLPEGTPVTAMDRPGIAYEWRGGKVAPSADPAAQKQAAKLANRSLRRSVWAWPTAIGSGVLGAAAIAFWWWRARR